MHKIQGANCTRRTPSRQCPGAQVSRDSLCADSTALAIAALLGVDSQVLRVRAASVPSRSPDPSDHSTVDLLVGDGLVQRLSPTNDDWYLCPPATTEPIEMTRRLTCPKNCVDEIISAKNIFKWKPYLHRIIHLDEPLNSFWFPKRLG